MKLAFALLTHGDPALSVRLIRLLRSQGHPVAIHFDAKEPLARLSLLAEPFGGDNGVVFASREAVAWGQWGVIRATLNCLRAIDAAGWNPDYVHLISGSDYPIRSSAELINFLERNGGDEFIESVPADTTPWVKTGPQQERYQYRWLFNWRRQPLRTDLSFALQKLLRWRRPFVRGLQPHIGSQWWTLTWPTLKGIMALSEEEDIIRFFKTTLVPDEIYFQTLVRSVADPRRIINTSLTHVNFSDYGYPVVYCSDHIDHLVRQPSFIARKFSPFAELGRDRLDRYWRGAARSPAMRDLNVGLESREYENHRLAYRHGAPGMPAIVVRGTGKALACLAEPFLAIAALRKRDLKVFADHVAAIESIWLHGELFHPERIEFADGLTAYAGYDRSDTILRNSDPQAFLRDVLRAQKSKTSGFLFRLDHGEPILKALSETAQARLVVVLPNVMTSFLESLETEESSRLECHANPLAGLEPANVADRFLVYAAEFQTGMKRLTDLLEVARAWRSDHSPVFVFGSASARETRHAIARSLGAHVSDGRAAIAEPHHDGVVLDLVRTLLRGGVDESALSAALETGRPSAPRRMAR